MTSRGDGGRKGATMTIASIVVLAAAAFAAIAIIVTALLPTPKPARRVRLTGSVRIRR